MKLEGRNAIVTGGSQGLGYHIARHFLAEGASVLICARHSESLRRAASTLSAGAPERGPVLWEEADVTSEADVDRVFQRAAKEWPGLDILVNCAGVAGPRGELTGVDWQDWKRSTDINLYGTAYPCRRAAQSMMARGYGKIINISGGGATKPLPSLSAYAASKAGMVRLTETLAVELQPHHVDVNAVAPGVLDTRIMQHFLEVKDQLGPGYEKEAERQSKDPMPAFDRAAQLCVFLASAASDGISGKLISAAWDPWETLESHREQLADSDVYTLRRIVPEDRGWVWKSSKS